MMQDIVGDIDSVENRTHDEIAIGDSAVLTRTLRPEDIRVFATMAGEVNPAHIDPEYARSAQFREIAGHGMWGSAMIANLLGTQFPGPGTVLVSQHLRFAARCASATPSPPPSSADASWTMGNASCSTASASIRMEPGSSTARSKWRRRR